MLYCMECVVITVISDILDLWPGSIKVNAGFADSLSAWAVNLDSTLALA
jgi:hypothetical protein